MSKLIIQIPCLNESKTLPEVIDSLPKSISGISQIEILVIDDGSSDNTSEVAKKSGVHHILRFEKNRGLAHAFREGLEFALKQKADFIVNTDADHQYPSSEIPKILEPLIQNKADLVIGARPISNISHFSFSKKFLQKLGSRVVKLITQTDIQDAPSGFRAMTRDTARKLNVFSEYTYTLETLIQASKLGLRVVSIPIHSVNPQTRPSRLVKSSMNYVRRSLTTLIRIFATYNPFYFFAIPGITFFLLGLFIGMRFLYFYLLDESAGHIQSLILCALLLGMGFFLAVTGIVADMISVNRKLLEQILHRLKKIDENLP